MTFTRVVLERVIRVGLSLAAIFSAHDAGIHPDTLASHAAKAKGYVAPSRASAAFRQYHQAASRTAVLSRCAKCVGGIIDLHVRLAAVLAKSNQCGKTALPANIQTTPAVPALLQEGSMLRRVERALPVLAFALVVGQPSGQLSRLANRQNSSRDRRRRVAVTRTSRTRPARRNNHATEDECARDSECNGDTITLQLLCHEY